MLGFITDYNWFLKCIEALASFNSLNIIKFISVTALKLSDVDNFSLEIVGVFSVRKRSCFFLIHQP